MSAQFAAHQKLGARFKLVARKANDDSISQETGWFNNIVLDTGLERMSVGTWISQCCVGTGNSTPVVTQTALDSFLASTSTKQSTSSGIQTTTAPYYCYSTVTWRFSEGVAAGNLTEVGLGWGTTTLWNRALIRDANDNPTTMTILSDEYLDVIAEVRCYPQQELSGSFNLLDKTGAVISTHTYVGMPYMYSTATTFSAVSLYYLSAYSSSVGTSVTAKPSTFLGDSHSTSGYTYPTTTSVKTTRTFSLTTANGTHQSFFMSSNGILASSSSGNQGYKIQIDPAITKTSEMELAYTYEMSWGRYETT